MNKLPPKEKLFFPNLDGLRTLAFLMVFSEHVFWSAFKYLEIKNPLVLHLCYTIFGNGGLGVSVFFVLSGFLITYLILKEQATFGKLDVKAFYVRRCLRIWPLYFLWLIFVFCIYPFFIKVSQLPLFQNPAETWRYFIFLSNFDMIRIHEAGKEAFMHSGVTWSIAIEEQFYLIWPLLFFLIPRKFQTLVFLPFLIISFIFRFYNINDPTTLYFHSLGVCSDLAVGGLAAFFSFKHPEKISRLFSPSDIMRLIFYLVGIFFVLFNEFIIAWTYWPVFNRFFITLFFGAVILDQNFSVSGFFKLSNIKSISLLGKFTYGLYLLHPLGYIIGKLFTDYFDLDLQGFIPRLIFSIAVLILTLFAALLSYYFLEQPFLKLKNRFSYISKE